MKNYSKDVTFLTLSLVASFILFSSCDQPTDLQSRWRDRDIVVDAKDNEWQDCRLYTDPMTQTDIGIYNDDDYVYLCLSTMDLAMQKAIVRQGLIVWFDETGGKRKALGLRYPVGASSGGGPDGDTYSVKELQILTSEKDTGNTFTVKAAALLDINVRIATDQSDRLIYELKMPLKKTEKTPYAVVPSQLNKIGLGVMTVKTAGRNTSGISGFGGSIPEIGSASGGASDSIKDSDEGGIMGSRVIDNDDPALGKVTYVRSTSKVSRGIEIWADVSLAARP